jgi:hypothetical protein
MIIFPNRNTDSFTKAGNEERTLCIKDVIRTLFLECGNLADAVILRTNDTPSAYFPIIPLPTVSELL